MVRKKNNKAPEPIVRIITEDSKSSLKYIEDLMRHYGKDPKLRVKVSHVGSSPRNIQCEVMNLLNDKKTPVHKIFCVFDKDSHDEKGNHYTNLLSYAEGNDKVAAINSVPCFEYWLLLHFTYTCYQFDNADAVQKKLKEHLPHYDKGRIDFHKDFKGHIHTAISNAKKSVTRYEKDGGDNPMTRMADLIEFLKS